MKRAWLPAIAVLLAPACAKRSDSPRPAIQEDYVLVGDNGATVFDAPPAGTTTGSVATHVGPGFGFVATGEARSIGKDRYVRIHDGRWLRDGEVSHVRPTRFAGARLAPGEALRLGWVVARAATVHAAADARAPAVVTRPRLTRLALAGPCRDGFCPLTVGWIRARDIAVPSLAPRPGVVGPRERWLDIDLASQTLVAYEGDEPRFATLVATGIGGPGSPLATPMGLFRIRSKHAMVRMDNLEHTGVVPYAYDVPLAQYFADGKALHAAPWHDQLGGPHSHGCVNLSPEDARWLFAFTAPSMAPGATEVAATATSPGTVVRVRGQQPDERGHSSVADASAPAPAARGTSGR